VPPGKHTDDLWTIIRSGMWRLYYQLSAEGKKRYYSELLPLLHETKLEVMGERDHDCYYLVYLGTKPSGRGKGYARKLIENMAVKVSYFAIHHLFLLPSVIHHKLLEMYTYLFSFRLKKTKETSRWKSPKVLCN
jgi:hypothetical protein